MVARLGAANNYKADHLAAEERQALLNGASFVHATGFFLTVAPDCLVSIGQHVAQNNKVCSLPVCALSLEHVSPNVSHLNAGAAQVLLQWFRAAWRS